MTRENKIMTKLCQNMTILTNLLMRSKCHKTITQQLLEVIASHNMHKRKYGIKVYIFFRFKVLNSYPPPPPPLFFKSIEAVVWCSNVYHSSYNFFIIGPSHYLRDICQV